MQRLFLGVHWGVGTTVGVQSLGGAEEVTGGGGVVDDDGVGVGLVELEDLVELVTEELDVGGWHFLGQQKLGSLGVSHLILSKSPALMPKVLAWRALSSSLLKTLLSTPVRSERSAALHEYFQFDSKCFFHVL